MRPTSFSAMKLHPPYPWASLRQHRVGQAAEDRARAARTQAQRGEARLRLLEALEAWAAATQGLEGEARLAQGLARQAHHRAQLAGQQDQDLHLRPRRREHQSHGSAAEDHSRSARANAIVGTEGRHRWSACQPTDGPEQTRSD